VPLSGGQANPYRTRQEARQSHTGAMKVRDVLRLLTDDGWLLVRTRGSHQQFKHPTKPGLVTVAGSGNDDLASGTLNTILKQAGLKDRRQD
jgi:predicted RNA binding protein YcfA (HicA-like mRNA interferase family)